MSDIKCPFFNGPCKGTYCALYDIRNRRCPHGAEASREKENLLKDIQSKVERIYELGRYRW